jgi:hypothetical protein
MRVPRRLVDHVRIDTLLHTAEDPRLTAPPPDPRRHAAAVQPSPAELTRRLQASLAVDAIAGRVLLLDSHSSAGAEPAHVRRDGGAVLAPHGVSTVGALPDAFTTAEGGGGADRRSRSGVASVTLTSDEPAVAYPQLEDLPSDPWVEPTMLTRRLWNAGAHPVSFVAAPADAAGATPAGGLRPAVPPPPRPPAENAEALPDCSAALYATHALLQARAAMEEYARLFPERQ